jgi:hypothetical protein
LPAGQRLSIPARSGVMFQNRNFQLSPKLRPHCPINSVNLVFRGLIPIIDFNVIGRRFTLTCFNEVFETQHERRPLHAAM